MKIDLYLNKINQEMIQVGTAIRADCVTYVSWTKQCCILDFRAPSPEDRVSNPGYLMRQEKTGGMLWSPRTGAVYKLDEEAYHTLLELDHGSNHELTAGRVGVPTQKVEAFVDALKRLGLR